MTLLPPTFAEAAAERSAPHLRLVPARERTDVALVAACIGGDEAAAAALWDRFYPLVRRITARTLGPGDVEDLTQDTFVRLFRLLPNLRDPDALRPFVIGVTTRVVRGELRRRRLRRWLLLSPTGELPEPPAEPLDHDAREALARFYAILDRFKPEARTAFVLRHMEGLELTEVAAALDVSLATVKRWLAPMGERVHAHARRDPALVHFLARADAATKGEAWDE